MTTQYVANHVQIKEHCVIIDIRDLCESYEDAQAFAHALIAEHGVMDVPYPEAYVPSDEPVFVPREIPADLPF